jgi:hypothetical protein
MSTLTSTLHNPTHIMVDLTYSESGAIVDYILNTYSPIPPAYSLHDSYFSHYAEGSLTMFLQMGITFTGSASMAPWYIKPIIDGFVGKVKVSTRYTA